MDNKDPYEKSKDVASQGYRKLDFGPDEDVNYRIGNAYNEQARPTDEPKTEIHKIAKHMTQSQFYSDKKKSE